VRLANGLVEAYVGKIDLWPDHQAVTPSLRLGARSDPSPKIERTGHQWRFAHTFGPKCIKPKRKEPR
jgi:hypothetical protein